MTQPVRGRRGIAVAPHALASQSALAVLRDGGNAIEAMVAAAATIAVVYPHMNGIGGDSFWLVGLPKADGDSEVVAIDACGASARGLGLEDYAGLPAIPFRGGTAALTVAGTLSGWEAALSLSRERLGGRLPLTRLLADAIDYARHGTPVTASQHHNTAGKRAGLETVSGFAETFLPGGEVPAIGSLFKHPRMAATLEHLAGAGLADFYRGELAGSIAYDLKAAGSPLVPDDLLQHRAQLRTPLMLQHSAGRVFNMPPPTQGLVSLMILGLMDRLGVERFDHLGADYVHAAVESVKQAFAVRDRHIGDPAHMTVDPSSFLVPGALDELAARIDMLQAAHWGAGRGPADTVWMGVIDGEGRTVSMIQSIYHEFGSGVVLPGTHINWQNRGCSFSLAAEAINSLRPGKKPFHTLNPALARLRDGRTLVYGTMGGDGQPQTQAAVYSRYAVFNQPVQQSVSAPRWLLGRTWGSASETLKLESRFSGALIEDLRARGHDIEVLGEFEETMGHAGLLVRHPNGALEGGFDPRGDGCVAGF